MKWLFSQYHIAPAAIIKNPRNLLSFCSRYRISYTFSPNFLLAQICRDITAAPYVPKSLDLSSMMAFISGGEAVPVKTAVDFADIFEQFGAPRDVLRGGFGMTETCVCNLDFYIELSTIADRSVGGMHLRHTANPARRKGLQRQVPPSREVL